MGEEAWNLLPVCFRVCRRKGHEVLWIRSAEVGPLPEPVPEQVDVDDSCHEDWDDCGKGLEEASSSSTLVGQDL